MARRTNYGFEKKQRELRKQKKKQEKPERRKRGEEEANSESEGGETADEMPSESEQAGGSGASFLLRFPFRGHYRQTINAFLITGFCNFRLN